MTEKVIISPHLYSTLIDMYVQEAKLNGTKVDPLALKVIVI